MAFRPSRWLDPLEARFPSSRRNQRRSPSRTARPRVEQLEDRVVPTLIAGAFAPPVAVEGSALLNQAVFHFTDTNANTTPGAYTASVNTGDATLTSAANPNNVQVVASGNGFDVQLSYTYAEELSGGTFSVQVTDAGGNATGASTSSPSGNGLNGTYVAGYTLGVPGAMSGDTAVALDGTSGHVNVPATALNNLSAGTLEAWVNLSANTNETIFAKQDNNINSYGIFSVGYQSPVGGGSPGHLYFQGHDYVPVAVSAGTVSTGSYHHVAVVFSSTAATFYIDGVQDSTTSGDYSVGNDTNATVQASIGAWLGDGAGHYLHGSVDELATYSTALSASQIAAHYQAAASGFAAYQAAVLANVPTAYYHLDETSGTVARDTSASPSSFSVADAPLTTTATPLTTAVYGTPFSGEVASFTDANPAATIADFPLARVVINWGDGTMSNAVSVTKVGTTFHVLGSHTWTAAGATPNPFLVTITDAGGATATTPGYTPTIARAPLTATGLLFTPTAGAPFSGVVASFTSAEAIDTSPSYTAQIIWGDGGTSAGTITDNGSGTFLVSGSHTYALAGTSAVGVVITHNLGYTTTATASGSAVVTNLGFGQTQDLDYWHGSAGQNLINSFNGGPTATALSNWLATSLPNIYGSGAGADNLTGASNAQVVAFFQNLWSHHQVSVDVQFLTAALNVYASTLSLGGAAGETAGFQVTLQGLGGTSYNAGNSGAAFGVANNASLTVSQMLAAANAQAVGGVLYSSNPSLRDPAEDLLDRVNQEGRAGILEGQTRMVSFWHGHDGQNLITAFNGGASATALSSWLAASFPNLYGAGAGVNDLTGQTNAQVAAFFQALWANHHDQADVQVLALALNVYASTQSLGGSQGQAAGFTVTAAGLGANSFNIGNSGAAAGVANNATLNVYDLLTAINNQAGNGALYGGNAGLLDLCEDLCEHLNRAGQ